MKVEILKTCDHIGVKKGEIYEDIRYWLDPNDKVTLLRRLTKKHGKPIGKSLDSNEYIHNVAILQ